MFFTLFVVLLFMEVYTTDLLRGHASSTSWCTALRDKLRLMCRRAGLCATRTTSVVFSKALSLEPWVARYRVNAYGHMTEGFRHVDVGFRVALCFSFVLVLEQTNTMLTLYDNKDDEVGTTFQLKAGEIIIFDARREHQVQIVPIRRAGEEDKRLICTGTFSLQ